MSERARLPLSLKGTHVSSSSHTQPNNNKRKENRKTRVLSLLQLLFSVSLTSELRLPPRLWLREALFILFKTLPRNL
ncbi:hypothetical protein PIB30_082635, partial [Stylosanthes scabra]|nr:hypothetical protein [Stylosanthes scabra]